MRTTVTLDPDVERLLHQTVRERGTSFKQVLNDAIRQGLSGSRSRQAPPFRQQTFSMGAEQLFSWDKALAVADQLEDEELLHKLSLRK